ncbi:hypothetical protein LTR94_024121, partial [Friedmanniomyces endolithicus]
RSRQAATSGASAAGGAALSDFGVGPRTDDLTAYRTLSPKRENSSISGSLVRDLNQTMSLTLSGELEDTSSFSYLGLPGLSLALPSASPYSPFAGDVLLHRYIDAPGALGRQTDTLSGQLGFLVDGYLGDWRWTVNGGYDRTETKTRTGRGLNDDALQAGVTAGTIDPFGDLGQLPTNPFDTARSISSKTSVEGVINGTAWEGPAGSLTSTFKVGFDSQSLDSENLRFSEEQQASVFSERSLSRDRTSASGNFNLPIASRDREVLGALGDLSANLNLAYEDLSDFGGLSAYTVGLNWSPWEPVNFTASWADEQKAPSMSQLNDPTISTPNVPVYDFATGQSVNIVRIEGGNPNLSEETKRVLKFGPINHQTNPNSESFSNNTKTPQYRQLSLERCASHAASGADLPHDPQAICQLVFQPYEIGRRVENETASNVVGEPKWLAAEGFVRKFVYVMEKRAQTTFGQCCVYKYC